MTAGCLHTTEQVSEDQSTFPKPEGFMSGEEWDQEKHGRPLCHPPSLSDGEHLAERSWNVLPQSALKNITACPHAGEMALCALLTSEATFSCSLFTVGHPSGQLSMFDLADFYSGCPSWRNPKWNLCLQLEVSQWSLPSQWVNHHAVEAHTLWTFESENEGAGSQFRHTGRDWACILEAQPKRPTPGTFWSHCGAS